ncbi:hypothetical protein QTP86_022627 [Hemibagrus guttatus]|nr:hypothetical protein QTP86_022627 [Hemibagrus guttatus]
MFLCRAALQRFSPLVRPSITHRAILHRDVVPRRLMSSVPGGTGQNLVYLVVCGGAFAGAIAYAYRTVTTDSARFTDRITEIGARPKNEWNPKPWPPQNAEEADEVAEEVVEEAAAEEAEPASVELVTDVKAQDPTSLVEKATEAVAEAAEVAAEVAVVEGTADEVAAVAHEVEKIAEEVEAAAKELETHSLPVVDEATAESHVTKDHIELVAASIVDMPVADLEKPVEAPVAPVAEEALVVEDVQVTPIVEEASVAPVLKDEPVASLVEEAAVSPVVEEVPVTPAVEKPADAPVVEAVPVAQVVEEALVDPVVEEVPVADEAPSVAPEEVPVPLVTEIAVMSSVVPEATEVPVVTESSEVLADSPTEDAASPVVAESEDKLSVEDEVVAEVTTSSETTAPPAALEDPEHEYVLVVLEGAPKTDKKVKVLGVSPVSGRIIPAPEEEEPAEQVAGEATPA